MNVLGKFFRSEDNKVFCFLVLCGGAFSFVWGDSIPFADLRKKIARDPVTSLALLDSIETVSSYPQYGIDYLRALAYCTQSKYYMAMHYASHALNNPQIRQDSVLLHSKIYFSKMDKADSLSVIYLRTLYQSAQAYNSLGKHKEAYNAMLRLYDIQSQIRVNIERNQMLDLTDVTKAVSREYELEKASYRMKIQRYVIEGLVGVMIFLLFLFGGLWRALLVIKRKNRKMAELILELDDQRNNGLSRYAMREAAGN